MSRIRREDTATVDRLDELFARSQREIEAHTDELADTETGRYFIDEASQLFAALRLWAQSQYRTDQVVRDILEAGDAVALHDVARQLRGMGSQDGRDRQLVRESQREQAGITTAGYRLVRPSSPVTLLIDHATDQP